MAALSLSRWGFTNLHVLIQRHQKTRKTLYGELPELPAQHLGDAGLADTQQIGGFDLFQTPLFQVRVDFEHQLRFDRRAAVEWTHAQ